MKKHILLVLTLMAAKFALGMEDINKQFIEAAIDGNLPELEALLLQNADINIQDKKGNTALDYATYFGCVKMVRLLLERGARVDLSNNIGYTPLLAATGGALAAKANAEPEGSYVEIVKLLLRFHVNVNQQEPERGSFALMTTSNPEICELLLQHGAQVDLADKNGNTALIAASDSGSPQVINILLKYGADINARDKYGDTGLLKAAQRLCDGRKSAGAIAVIKLLVAQEADVNRANNNGTTPLMDAARNGIVEMVNLLLKHGADAFASRSFDSHLARAQTALMIVAECNQTDSARALLTTISDADAQEIHKNWDKILSIRFWESAFLNKDMRKRLIQELFHSIVDDRMNRAMALINQKNVVNERAYEIAKRNYIRAPVLTLLDPNNQESLNKIRALIEKNVRKALLSAEQMQGEK